VVGRRQNPTSKDYDYKLIYDRLQSLLEAKEEGDALRLVNLLRSGALLTGGIPVYWLLTLGLP
jgi:hypothetical protein